MSNQVNMLEELSNFIFTSKYARYNEKLQRRETWEESCNRLQQMHLDKFKKLSKEDIDEIKWAFDLVKDKRIVPSMRSMQFGGKAILSHESKSFNCSVRHIDSIRAFSEVFYLSLNGVGTGFGLSNHFLNRLPDLVQADDKTGTVITYVIEDKIEGWSDSVEALLLCYFKNTAYSGRKIVFDYSKIRKKGALLKTTGGKAPGYKGLKNAHIKIKVLLDRIIEEYGQTRLKTIDAYDILCHMMDAVLSGGIRRSAASVVFDKDDDVMMKAKTGDWFKTNPQRARTNNSVLLLRDEVTLEEFTKYVEISRKWGEPAFVFSNHKYALFNPCQPDFATVLTPEGIRELRDIKIGHRIWSESGWTTVIQKNSNGIEYVYKYSTTAGSFIGTKTHKLVSKGQQIEAQNCKNVDTLQGELVPQPTDLQAIMDGLMIGDGSVHLRSKEKVYLIIGNKDQDYFTSEIAPFILERHAVRKSCCWKVKTTIKPEELHHLPERVIPDRYLHSSGATLTSFLKGLFSANGSIAGDRVTLKSSCFKLIEQVQLMLSSIGIISYYTTNKAKDIKWKNGTYKSKQSYDLNISVDRDKFKAIGFLQRYKMVSLDETLVKQEKKPKKINYDVIKSESLEKHEVFSIAVDNQTHTYWSGGLNVKNCFEINFCPITEDGVCGVQFCNLTSINGIKIKTIEQFKECVKAATILGTLQATYTHFPYLSGTAKQLTEEEALLGVSITGMLDSPKILLNPEHQREMAQYAVKVNKEWAKKLNINQAARVTTVKPEGTTSLIFGSGSGIHPQHAKKFFRRVQNNKTDNVFKFFKKENPHMVEESIWSANKTDEIITFPLEIADGVMVKDDLTAIKHLEIVKNTQLNWVNYGTTEANKKPIKHNVSCTIQVRDNEWDDVIKYIYKNRENFTAVSLLSYSGDKDYKLAPNEKVSTKKDEEIFNNLLKDYKPVDYTKLVEKEDETHLTSESACQGNKCEI